MSIATSLKAKLLAAFALVLILMLLTAGIALWQMRIADVAADQVTHDNLPSINALCGMDAASNQLRRLLYAQACADTPAESQAYEPKIAANANSFETCLTDFAAMDKSPDESRLLEEVHRYWEPVKAAITPVRIAASNQDLVDALKAMAASNEASNKLIAAIEELVAINKKEAEIAGNVQDRAVEKGYWITGLSAAVVLVIGILIALRLAHGIVKPVGEVGGVLGALANGDLTRRATVTSTDEVGVMAGSLNSTLDGLGGIVGGITRNAQGIAGAADELTAVSKRLTGNAETSSAQSSMAASAATQISASISTFAAGIEEMGVTVNEIAKSAGQAASVAQEGVSAAGDANTAMNRLGTSSNEIGDIVKVIAGIAEQTNLLALNATIEAARAGEAGRGFAVVASEVKDLARKTTAATADIHKRVAGIQGDSKLAQESLQRITEIVGKINDIQQSIASAIEEQSATNKELAGNVSQVAKAGTDIATNVNAVAGAAKDAATGAGETLAAANALARQAADLRQAVARFRT